MLNGPQQTGAQEGGATSASRAYELLRRDVLFGTFPPGSKLLIDRLRERYAIGAIPLREALNRLSAERLINQSNQRGFSVRSVSRGELRELGDTRCWINEVMVREGMKHATPQWEDALILCGHRLLRAARTPAGGESINPQWEAIHRQFHLTLVAPCPSEWLQKFHADLFDYTDFYRNRYLAAKPIETRNVDAEHGALFDAALNHDVAELTKILNEHVLNTVQTLTEQLGPDD